MDKDVRLMLAIHVIWSHVLHGGCNDMPIRKREVTNNPTYPVRLSSADWIGRWILRRNKMAPDDDDDDDDDDGAASGAGLGAVELGGSLPLQLS